MGRYQMDSNFTFLVSQKAVIQDEQGRILMLCINAPGTQWDDQWGAPGGLVQMREPLDEALKREVLEETGLEISIAKILAVSDHLHPNFIFKNRQKKNARFIDLIYLCISQGGEVKLSDEHKDFAWVNTKDISSYNLTTHLKKILEVLVKEG